jgi:folate-dependent phosphoribosylglycinamide formyltransferase PurN
MLTSPCPIRVGVLCSHRAPGLLHLLDSLQPETVGVVCVIATDAEFSDAGQVRARGIPVITHDIRAFYAARSAPLTRDPQTREAFDRQTLDMLHDYQPDLVLLDGYLFLLTLPMLDAFPHRLLNLHFSDLTVRNVDHRPSYVGIRAVRDAILDGQCETRATLHLVNSEPDGGAPLVRSWAFPVSPLVEAARAWQAPDMLKAYAYAHQEWMMREVSGPLLAAALQLIADGRLVLDGIGSCEPHLVEPWLVDKSGRLTAPDTLRALQQPPDSRRGARARANAARRPRRNGTCGCRQASQGVPAPVHPLASTPEDGAL